MIKYLRYIFIPFLAVILMSHNVSAFTISENVTSKGYFSAPYWAYRVTDGTWSSHRNSSLSRSSSDANITGIRFYSSSNTNVSVNAGDYIVVHGWATFTEAVYSDNFRNITGYIGLSSASETRNCNIINFDNSIQEYNTGTGNANGLQRFTFDVTCVVLSDNNLPTLNFYTRSNVSGVSGTTLTINFTGWDWYEPAGDIAQQEQQASDNIENQSPSDVGSSDNAGTTNLINTLGGFITTIANAPATNCIINGDLGNVDIGGIDLCQGKENFNTLVEFIGFSALFGVVFWAGYHLVKRTLSLIDWARSK